jgi:hypothetical protein
MVECGYCHRLILEHPVSHCKYNYEEIKHPLNEDVVGYKLLVKEDGKENKKD